MESTGAVGLIRNIFMTTPITQLSWFSEHEMNKPRKWRQIKSDSLTIRFYFWIDNLHQRCSYSEHIFSLYPDNQISSSITVTFS